MRFLSLFCTLFVLGSCGSPSEGSKSKVLEELVSELEGISSRQELQRELPKLTKLFDQIGAQIIERGDEPSCAEDLPPVHSDSSEKLKTELIRIYKIEGGRELIESAQRPALLKLSATRS